MDQNPYTLTIKELPDDLPIFPLDGVLLLPCGQLPLNIFEPRYVAMVNHAMATHRMIGMIQPREIKDGDTTRPVYEVGCAGKITDFHETPDGRYSITLTGISRFKIAAEQDLDEGGFRRVKPKWCDFKDDFEEKGCLGIDRDVLKSTLQTYFHTQGMECDWDAVDDAPDGRLITCLSMVCPFGASEKQALLETICCQKRARLFMQMLDMASQTPLSSAKSDVKTQH